MKRLLTLTTLIVGLLVAAIIFVADNKDESTKVTVTIILPKELASFADRTLELRLYEYDPFLADVGADLVDSIAKRDFSHTTGTSTELKIDIGVKGKIKPARSYYVTSFVLDEGKRTHMGEKDGSRGLTKVISDGHPSEVTMVFRALR